MAAAVTDAFRLRLKTNGSGAPRSTVERLQTAPGPSTKNSIIDRAR